MRNRLRSPYLFIWIALAILFASAAITTPKATAADLSSNWEEPPDRVWIGPGYWANPMEDWRVSNGEVECITPGPNRGVEKV